MDKNKKVLLNKKVKTNRSESVQTEQQRQYDANREKEKEIWEITKKHRNVGTWLDE